MRPFWQGFYSVFGFGILPPPRTRRIDGLRTDEDAIAADWQTIASDWQAVGVRLADAADRARAKMKMEAEDEGRHR